MSKLIAPDVSDEKQSEVWEKRVGSSQKTACSWMLRSAIAGLLGLQKTEPLCSFLLSWLLDENFSLQSVCHLLDFAITAVIKLLV